jgi:hypothetical protein
LRRGLALALGLLLGVSFVVGVIALAPPTDDYSLQNPYWNGMSQLAKSYGVTPMGNLTMLSDQPELTRGEALLVIGPTTSYTQEQENSVSGFVRSGGLLVVADDFGSGNQLLQMMGMGSRFDGRLLVDPLYNIRAEQLPTITDVNLPSVASIAFDYATFLNVSDPQASILASSSPYSYVDVNGTGTFEQGDPLGPLPVMASIRVGSGSVVLVSDSSLYLNGMIAQLGNNASLSAIIGSREPLMDTGHWSEGTLTMARAALTAVYQQADRLDIRYAIVVGAVSSIFLVKVKPREEPEEGDDMEAVMNEHPDWDKEELKKLIEERRKNAASRSR